jgi:hypothetical protein
MCGADKGYPHDDYCPYPMYHGDVRSESTWMFEYRKKKHGLELKTLAIKTCLKFAEEHGENKAVVEEAYKEITDIYKTLSEISHKKEKP